MEPPKATIGRIVHYYSATDGGPFAALVMAVDLDQRCHLHVFRPYFEAKATFLAVGFEAREEPDWWTWPPRTT